jgi:type I restriction enzyme R subunit
MNLALKQYSEGDKDNFEDIAESIIIVRNHLDLLAKLFHTFDNSKYFKGTTIQQLNTLNLQPNMCNKPKNLKPDLWAW